MPDRLTSEEEARARQLADLALDGSVAREMAALVVRLLDGGDRAAPCPNTSVLAAWRHTSGRIRVTDACLDHAEAVLRRFASHGPDFHVSVPSWDGKQTSRCSWGHDGEVPEDRDRVQRPERLVETYLDGLKRAHAVVAAMAERAWYPESAILDRAADEIKELVDAVEKPAKVRG